MAETVQCHYCKQVFPVKEMKKSANIRWWICKDEMSCLARSEKLRN